jgi:hypothetical protein
VLWFEADLVEGVASGSGVATLINRGSAGSSLNVTQATGSKQPVYTSNQQNSLPGLVFTAANQQEMRSGAVSISPRTIIAIYSTTTTDGIYDGSSTNYTILRVPAGPSGNVVATGSGGGTLTGTSNNLGSSQANIVTVTLDTTNSILRQNGLQTTGSLTGVTNTQFALASAVYRGGSTYWGGTLFALLIWNTVLGIGQIKQVETAGALKYNLTAYDV